MFITGLTCWGFVAKYLFIMFRTRIVVDLPVSEPFKTFKIIEKGGFAIWEEGPIFKKSVMAFSTPQIIHVDSKKVIKLSRSYGNVTKTGFARSSRQVYFCDLDAGQYIIEIQASSSLGQIDQIITNTLEHMVSIPTAPLQQYSIQLRKSLSKRQRLLLLPMVFIGLFLFNIGLFTILYHAFGIQLEGALGA